MAKKAKARRRVTVKRARAVAASGEVGRAKTIVYVHGIGNKPKAEILKCQWDEALFGFNLGERSRLAYWVNRIFYPDPMQASCAMADATHDATRPDDAAAIAVRAVASGDDVEALLPPEAESARARAALERLARAALKEPDTGGAAAADFHARVLPLPRPLREFISRRITKAFLKDVHEFLFVEERREV